MLLFTQISVITLVSFLVLRNLDKPLEYVPPFIDDGSGISLDDQEELYNPDQFEINLTSLRMPIILTFSMSLLLLPFPSCFRRCFFNKYYLNDQEDDENENQEEGVDDFIMNNQEFGSQFFEDSFTVDEADIAPTDINKTEDEKKK